MKKTLAALLFLLFALTGCLEFDAQDIDIRYDETKDRIDIHIVYRGLFAEDGQGGSKNPLEKAQKDLADAKESGEVAFWCNWPFSFDLTRDYPAPIRAMLAHVDVENGPLFTDPQGTLCATQFVRIREAKAFLRQLNTALELYVQSQLLGGTAGRGGTHTWDGDTKELVREFLRSGEKLLMVQPGRIELRLPLSTKDHQWLRGQFEQLFQANMPREMLRRVGVAEKRENQADPTSTAVTPAAVTISGEQLAKEVQRSASYRFFWDNEIGFLREADLTRITFGAPGQQALLVKKASDGLYHPALLTKLRDNGEKIEDGLPEQELERRFAAFRERDATLPPKVAALRQGGDKASGGEKK